MLNKETKHVEKRFKNVENVVILKIERILKKSLNITLALP